MSKQPDSETQMRSEESEGTFTFTPRQVPGQLSVFSPEGVSGLPLSQNGVPVPRPDSGGPIAVWLTSKLNRSSPSQGFVFPSCWEGLATRCTLPSERESRWSRQINSCLHLRVCFLISLGTGAVAECALSLSFCEAPARLDVCHFVLSLPSSLLTSLSCPRESVCLASAYHTPRRGFRPWPCISASVTLK